MTLSLNKQMMNTFLTLSASGEKFSELFKEIAAWIICRRVWR